MNALYFVRQDKQTNKVTRSKMKYPHSYLGFKGPTSYTNYVIKASNGGKNRIVGYDLIDDRKDPHVWIRRTIIRQFTDSGIIITKNNITKNTSDVHNKYLRGEVSI